MQGCSNLQNRFDLKGNIALIERGYAYDSMTHLVELVFFLCAFSECSFVTKIVNAQETGALGVIVMNNDQTTDDRFVDMIDDSTKRNVHIPAMFLQYRDG